MKDISITEKLILLFVFIGLVAIITVGSYSYHAAKKALLNRTFDQLISLRLEKKNRVEQFFLDRIRDVNFIAESEEILKTVNSLPGENSSKKANAESITIASVNQIIRTSGYYHRLFLIDRQDLVFEINPDTVTAEANQAKIPYGNISRFCRELLLPQGKVIQDLTRDQPYIYLGSAILDNNKQSIGFVVAEVPVSALNDIMIDQSENNGLGKTGETYLVSSDYLMRSNSRFTGNAILNIQVRSESVRDALNGKTGTRMVQDYRDITCLSSYSQVNIEGLRWVILAEMDEKEAMTPVYAIRNSILLISLIIAASVFILALVISFLFTAPIKKLQRASEQIGDGDYDIHLPVSSKDELGRLTGTFNRMVARLKKQSDEIEVEKTKRISSLLDGQEIERQRLARDLHDSLGQSILTANIKLEQAGNTDPQKSKQIISETQELLKSIIQEVRVISNDLMPSILTTFGIDQGLNNFCRETAKNTGIDIAYSGENIPGSLDSGLQIYLFRITQEAINNIIKHSRATEASVGLHYHSNSLNLTIADNGRGFDPGSTKRFGNGILNIRERVKSLQGICEINSTIGQGTIVEITIPLN